MPTKRPSKKRREQAGRPRSRRSGKPNVYVQPADNRAREEAEQSAPAVSVGAPAMAGTTGVAARPRASRRQQGRQRSEVFARTLPSELRKLSILVVLVAIALTALTLIMRQTA